jgi:hypothetical protein
MKINFEFVVGCCIIAFWVGAATVLIGQPYTAGKFEWYIVLQVLLIFVPVFIFGFLGGRGSKNN